MRQDDITDEERNGVILDFLDRNARDVFAGFLKEVRVVRDISPTPGDDGKLQHKLRLILDDQAASSPTIAELIKESHATAVEKGWWERKDTETAELIFSRSIANITGEIAETWEEFRKHAFHPNSLIYGNSKESDGGTTVYGSSGDYGDHDLPAGVKPEGIAVEFADVLIRIFDTCAALDIPLEKALRLKMAYNKTRPYRHGGKHA